VPFYHEPGKVEFNFQSPAVVTGKLRRRRMMSVEEFVYARGQARRPVKVTLPSPLMLFLLWAAPTKEVYSDPFELFADGVELVREEAQELANLGCEYIQIDAPDFGQLVAESERERWEALGIPVERVLTEGVDMLNAVADVPGVNFGLHLCRGNYESMWISAGGYETISKQVFRRATNYDRFLLEFDDERSGSFEPLKDLPDDKVVVLGLVSSKTNDIETVADIVRRVDEASKVFPRDQLALSTQCGFASVAVGNDVSEKTQEQKLRVVADAAQAIWG
jgi:5-methyltetrahydropteroyltriglutamate--homocysteine methyltransferase